VPRCLEELDRFPSRITFRVVGRDAASPDHDPVLRSIVDAGHEIGNHSYDHDPWLHLYSRGKIEADLGSAAAEIRRATGRTPVGFRGPGFTLSDDILAVLNAQGYRYDASTFPTFLGPLARAYYFLHASLTPEQRRERSRLFGTLADGLRPLRPYCWTVADRGIVEIPVTTFPVLRTPFHLSYVIWLSQFSERLARAYFGSALRACRLLNMAPSILLHPLDFLSGSDAPSLRFFPGMDMPASRKIGLVRNCLADLHDRFQVLTLEQHAEHLLARVALPRIEPNLAGRNLRRNRSQATPASTISP
ncbi:MAG TPA: polysaccharide deacetylase family protein, partial [Bacteroidota bacterium]